MARRIQRDTSWEGRWLGMPKAKGRVMFQPRFWVLCVVLLTTLFLPIFRSQNGQAQKQRAQLAELQQKRYEEQMRGERLKLQILDAGTASFQEREARQRYGYAMPGIIRFMAENFSPQEQAVSAFETVALEGQAPEGGAPLDKDWGNFH